MSLKKIAFVNDINWMQDAMFFENIKTRKMPFRSPYSYILELFYNSGNYCFINPRTIEYKTKNTEKGSYATCESRRIFQFLVLLLHCLALSPHTYELHFGKISGRLGGAKGDFAGLFRRWVLTFWLLSLLNMYRVLWTRSKERILVLNKIQDISRDLVKIGVVLPSRKYMAALGKLFFAVVICGGVFDWCVDGSISQQGPRSLPAKGACRFLEAPHCQGHQGNESHGEVPVPVTHLIFGSLVYFTDYICNNSTIFADLIPLINAVVFYCLVKHYVNFLRVSNTIHSQEDKILVLKIFKDFCELSTLMNNSIGSNVACTCFLMLPYYALRVKGIFQIDNVWQSLQFGRTLTVIGLFYILAAEANSMLGELVDWLQTVQKEKPHSTLKYPVDVEAQEKIMIALTQLQRNQMGIRGLAFTVSYGFVGNIISLVLTYSIILSQLQSS